MLDRIRRILIGDHQDTDAAIDDFVAAVLGGDGAVVDTAEMKKAVAAVTRRIEATVAMLADPDFDGLDELRDTLAKLKARRDDLQADLEQIERTGPGLPDKADLRDWAGSRIALLDGDIDTYQPSPELRQLVQNFVKRIEIDPNAKRGAIHLPKDIATAYQHLFVGNAAHGNRSDRARKPARPSPPVETIRYFCIHARMVRRQYKNERKIVTGFALARAPAVG